MTTKKPTYRNGRHPSRDGGFVEPVELDVQDWQRLEAILERALTDAERDRIKRGLATYLSLKVNDDSIPLKQVRATLRAIINEPDGSIHDAFENCDSTTEACLDEALLDMGEDAAADLRAMRPGKLRAAALLAEHRLPKTSGGRPQQGYKKLFAEWVVILWRDLGRSDVTVWEQPGLNGDLDGKAAPLVQFAAALLELIEYINPPGNSAVAKLLRTVSS